jgi:hypothetical protein
MVSKLLEIWSSLLIPDPGSGSLLFTHPGSRGKKGTWSRIRVRNTGYYRAFSPNYFEYRLWTAPPFSILNDLLGAAASAWSMCGRCASRWTAGRRGWTTIHRRSCADSSASYRSGSGPSTITPGTVVQPTQRDGRGLARAPNWPLHSCTGRQVGSWHCTVPEVPCVFGKQQAFLRKTVSIKGDSNLGAWLGSFNPV